MFPGTLVQYENPQKARQHSTKETIEKIVQRADAMVPIEVDDLSTMDCNTILDTLLPPRVEIEDDGFWFQKISRAPASSSDLLRLQEELDAELVKREAREVGVCPIRTEIYDQCFEELIRQECVVCPERGRLLRMVYLEAKLSLKSSMECYESALAYGLKKMLVSARETERLTGEVTELLGKVAMLADTRQELELRLPKVKGECEKKEKEYEDELKVDEEKIESENAVVLKQMMEFVNIHLEKEE